MYITKNEERLNNLLLDNCFRFQRNNNTRIIKEPTDWEDNNETEELIPSGYHIEEELII